jgi:hypothetical protein
VTVSVVAAGVALTAVSSVTAFMAVAVMTVLAVTRGSRVPG